MIADRSGTRPNVIWAPQAGSQTLSMTCRVFECLVHGNRGGGKTDGLLMDFAQHVGPKRHPSHQAGYGQEWRGILFRRTYPELDDAIAKSHKWFPQMFPGARFTGSPRPAWHFPDGETLLFRQLNKEYDYEKFHGHAFPWIGFEELTTWPLDTLYRRMMSCARSSYEGIPIKVRSTCNPSGPGHNWVRKRFRLPAPHGKQIGSVIHLPGEKPRTSIRSYLHENQIMLKAMPDYQSQILMAAKNNAELLAWRDGDWNIVAGGMFDDVWDFAVHIVPSFPVRAIPRGWRIDRSYDHGSSHPFSVGWWAESNGEPFEWEGRLLGSVPGDLFRIYEWYGSANHNNEGLRLTSGQIADGILDREHDWGLFGKVHPGPADSQIFIAEPGVESTALIFDRAGVRFLSADKGPGSRKQGWEVIRRRLQDSVVPVSGIRENPGIFFCSRCSDAIDKLPILPRSKVDQDDVDTESEDHIGDEVRYRVRRKQASNSVNSWR